MKKKKPAVNKSERAALLRRTPLAMAVLAAVGSSNAVAALPQQVVTAQSATAVSARQAITQQAIYFIDAGVEQADIIRRQIPAGAAVVELSAFESGIEQITAALERVGDVQAVHVISHGGVGYLRLGSDVLSADTLAYHRDELKAWQASLGDKADILFYGCNVAASAEGVALLDEVKALTGADVAASSDQTGNAAKGGDWQLEYHRGGIETAGLNVPAFPDTLATITVDGSCTLSDAINSANNDNLSGSCAAGSGADTINFASSGQYTLAGNLPDVYGGSLTIDGDVDGDGNGDVVIDGGSATYGIFWAYSADLTLNNLTVQNGSAAYDMGGAVNAYNATVTVNNSVFTNNHSDQGGGAIAAYGSTITANNSTFSNNSSYGFAGAIFGAYYSTVTATDSIFSNNSADNPGGAIFNAYGSTLAITNSSFSGNTSNAVGGAIISAFDAPTTVKGSTFAGNSAYYAGGAIVQYYGSNLFVANSTFSGNTANYVGAAIGNYGSSPATVVNSTFVGNIGESTLESYSSTLTLSNSIIADPVLPAGSSASAAYGCYSDAGLTASGNNLSTDSSCGSATVVTLGELNLGTLADNGGPTQTIALQSGSVAIDAGEDTAALDSDGATALATDQRGEARISGTAVDVGAYERQPTDTDSSGGSSTSSSSSSSGGGASGLLTLLFGFLGLFIRRLRPKS